MLHKITNNIAKPQHILKYVQYIQGEQKENIYIYIHIYIYVFTYIYIYIFVGYKYI